MLVDGGALDFLSDFALISEGFLPKVGGAIVFCGVIHSDRSAFNCSVFVDFGFNSDAKSMLVNAARSV